MHNYYDYTEEDLAQDDFFRRWFQQPDSETNAFWTDFMTQYPEKQSVVVAARALLKAVEQVQVLPTQAQGNQIWAKIQQQIQDDATELVDEPQVHRIGYWRQWAAAAAILLLVGFGWWFARRPETIEKTMGYIQPKSQTEAEWIDKVNETNHTLSIKLSDGSQVVLQPQSRVNYPKTFSADKREIRLEGEGFFEVTKNSRQPFMVYANGLITQVVGTSFTIKAFPKMAKITVAVHTGKVAVFTAKALHKSQEDQQRIAGMLLLTPNQQAIFDKGSERLTARLVDEPTLVKKPETKQYFVFENTAVSDVFHKLEESYGISIQYDPAIFEKCSLTAPLGNEPLFRKLDIICQTIGATYEVWGTKVIISGPGCQPKS
ncbi:FecR family protein [Spirosoma aureum]|uniref:FecR family protein n=1 Tax=Spirosoma aureum TaxID=2692134 RepID=A0A6G9AXW5_9BACT|nr:FecR family protein [Spirosoma aureum]QIP17302.1 FecR family protein [Spirosoma aureum]